MEGPPELLHNAHLHQDGRILTGSHWQKQMQQGKKNLFDAQRYGFTCLILWWRAEWD